MTRGRLRQWLVLGVAIVTAGALGTTSASAQSAVPAASAGAPSAKAQACIKGSLLCTEVQDYEHAFGGVYVGTSRGRAIAISGS